MHLLDERLSAVLAVIYFIFNEGYFCSTGKYLISTELCNEAIYLAEFMLKLMLKATEVSGLLAPILNIDQLTNYYPYHAARAAMHKRLGQFKQARISYRSAIDLCGNRTEKNYLEKKFDQCDDEKQKI